MTTPCSFYFGSDGTVLSGACNDTFGVDNEYFPSVIMEQTVMITMALAPIRRRPLVSESDFDKVDKSSFSIVVLLSFKCMFIGYKVLCEPG